MSCAASGSSTKWVKGNKTTNAGVGTVNTETPIRPGADLNLTRDTLSNDTIVGGRQKKLDRTGNDNVEGSFPAYFANDNVDDFLEMAMLNEWVADVDGDYNKKLTIGEEVITFDIEDQQEDFNVYQVTRGVTVGSMSFSSPIDDYTTCDFSLVGASQELATSTADATLNTGVVPAVVKDPFAEKDGSIMIDGSPVAIAQSVSFELSNNFNKFVGWGASGIECQVPGRIELTGEVTLAMNAVTDINMFINETVFDIVLEFSLGGDKMKVTIPECRYTGASKPTVDETRIVTLPFTAGYNSTANSTLVIQSSSSI